MALNEATEGRMTNSLSNPILVPLDGTDVAEGILPYVSQIAIRANTPLVILTVVDFDAIDYPSSALSALPSSAREFSLPYRDQFEESLRVHALESLREVASRLGDTGATVEIRATVGHPAEEILRVSGEEGCGLIAMSTRGRNPISRSVLGSVTDKVLHASSVPVLTMSPERASNSQEEGTSLATIISPLDGSQLAESALPLVEGLAQVLEMEVLLTKAVRIEYPAYSYAEVAINLPDFAEEVVQEASDYLEEVSKRLGDRGLTVRTQVPVI